MITLEEFNDSPKDILGVNDMTSTDVFRDMLGVINIPDEFYNIGFTWIELLPNCKKDSDEYMLIRFGKDRYILSMFEPAYAVEPESFMTDEQKEILYSYTSSHWNYLVNLFKEIYKAKYNMDTLIEHNTTDKVEHINWPSESPDYRLL